MLEDKENIEDILNELGLKKRVRKKAARKHKKSLDTILIVEPDDHYRKTAVEYFRSENLKVDFADDNLEAREKIKKATYKGAIFHYEKSLNKARWVKELDLPAVYLNRESDASFSIYKKGTYGLGLVHAAGGLLKNTKIWQDSYRYIK